MGSKNRKKRKSKEVMERLIEELKNNGGVVIDACRAVGVGKTTFYRWQKEDEEFRKKVEEAVELGNLELIDLGVKTLKQKIEEGDLTATIFVLKTLGKRRGFTERVELEKKDVEEFSSTKIQIYLPKKGGGE
ncbi:MAG: hypothetical protein C6I01_01805 [Epsilonproteobacteria bacterium]|nr:hypothetical protein [Campylobacterota bacterium]